MIHIFRPNQSDASEVNEFKSDGKERYSETVTLKVLKRSTYYAVLNTHVHIVKNKLVPVQEI